MHGTINIKKIVFINSNFLRECTVISDAVYQQFLFNFKFAEGIKILIAAVA